MTIANDKHCQTCIFYGLCTKADLPHCNGEEYYGKEYNSGRKEESK